MACFERASPALKQILLQLYRFSSHGGARYSVPQGLWSSGCGPCGCVQLQTYTTIVATEFIRTGLLQPGADKPLAVEHHLHEFGSLQYHIQSYASELHLAYLSISTPLLSTGSLILTGLPHSTIETVKKISQEVIEIIQPARSGYQLTLKLDFAKIPRKKDAVKIITEISSVQAVILSSQLREMLRNVNAQEISQGTYKPIKLVYHPREPFYVVKQPAKLTAVFPIRFKEDSEVVIAKAFFQELVDVGSSGACARAPPCYWSPIPPPELRGESMEDLSTNGGFVSFEISSRHVEGKKLDKTVWNLLNFNALVKYHVKCTKGFVQRRMRSRLESLVEALQHPNMEEDYQIKKVKGHRGVKKLLKFTRCKVLLRRWNLPKKMKTIHSRIRIRGFRKFQRRWLKLPSFASVMNYQKLDKSSSFRSS